MALDNGGSSTKKTPPSRQGLKERESALDSLRERRRDAEDKEKLALAAEDFDHDFDSLRDVIDDFTHMGSATVTSDGLVLEVNGILVKRIVLRKIEQIMRFEAAEGYPLEPKYEVVIEYQSKDGNMADTVVVDYEELFKKPISETVSVIRERVMEAKRLSGRESVHVWAIHTELHKKDGEIEHEVRSDGTKVSKKRDYDGRVRVEIEKTIDAIRSAIALNEAKKKIREVGNDSD